MPGYLALSTVASNDVTPRERSQVKTFVKVAALLGDDLPAPVRDALRARQALETQRTLGVPDVDRAVRAAMEAASARVARSALDGTTVDPGELDVTEIETARQEAQRALDRAVLQLSSRNAATLAVLAACVENRAAIVRAVQSKHQRVIAGFVGAAAILPARIDSDSAVQAGDPIRTAWITANDTHSHAEQLREAVELMEPANSRWEDERSRWLSWTRTRDTADQWSPRRGGVALDDGTCVKPGTLPHYLWLAARCPRPSDWWAPTRSEREALVVKLFPPETPILDRLPGIPAYSSPAATGYDR